jgi:hypothetical protein
LEEPEALHASGELGFRGWLAAEEGLGLKVLSEKHVCRFRKATREV